MQDERKRILEMLLPPVSICILGGCASDPWEWYEDSLYESMRVPSADVYEQHTALLGEIVEYYGERERKPPPGVLAEYGFYLARTGKADQARGYLQAEKEAYPESAVFVTVLERSIEGRRAFQPDSTGKPPSGDGP